MQEVKAIAMLARDGNMILQVRDAPLQLQGQCPVLSGGFYKVLL
jgi:hypothetical protein